MVPLEKQRESNCGISCINAVIGAQALDRKNVGRAIERVELEEGQDASAEAGGKSGHQALTLGEIRALLEHAGLETQAIAVCPPRYAGENATETAEEGVIKLRDWADLPERRLCPPPGVRLSVEPYAVITLSRGGDEVIGERRVQRTESFQAWLKAQQLTHFTAQLFGEEGFVFDPVAGVLSEGSVAMNIDSVVAELKRREAVVALLVGARRKLDGTPPPIKEALQKAAKKIATLASPELNEEDRARVSRMKQKAMSYAVGPVSSMRGGRATLATVLNVRGLPGMYTSRGCSVREWLDQAPATVVILPEIAGDSEVPAGIVWKGSDREWRGVGCGGSRGYPRGGVAVMWDRTLQGAKVTPAAVRSDAKGARQGGASGSIHRKVWARVASAKVPPVFVCGVYIRPSGHAGECLRFLEDLQRDVGTLRLADSRAGILVGGDFNPEATVGTERLHEIMRRAGLHPVWPTSPTFFPPSESQSAPSTTDGFFVSDEWRHTGPAAVDEEPVGLGHSDHAAVTIPVAARAQGPRTGLMKPSHKVEWGQGREGEQNRIPYPSYSDPRWPVFRREGAEAIQRTIEAPERQPAIGIVTRADHALKQTAAKIFAGVKAWNPFPKKYRVDLASKLYRVAWKRLKAEESEQAKSAWLEARRYRNRTRKSRTRRLRDVLARRIDASMRRADPHGVWKVVDQLQGKTRSVLHAVHPEFYTARDAEELAPVEKRVQSMFGSAIPLVVAAGPRDTNLLEAHDREEAWVSIALQHATRARRARPPTDADGADEPPPGLAEELTRTHPALGAFVADVQRGESEWGEAFTDLEVKDAIGRIERHKAPGVDDVPPALFKCAQEQPESRELLSQVAKLVNLVWAAMEWTEEMSTAWLAFILKKPHLDPLDLDSYRIVAVPTALAKIVARCAVARLNRWAKSVGAIPQEQSGFREGVGCEDNHLVLRVAIQESVRRGQPLYVLFLDVVKAYDSVMHSKLLWRLIEKRVPWVLWLYAALLVTTQRLTIRERGTTVPQRCGVPQGSVASPLLFSLFFSDLVGALEAEGVQGVDLRMTTGEVRWVRSLLFADDTATVAKTETDLQRAATACENFARANGLKFHVGREKTEIVVFGARKQRERAPEVHLQGERVPVAPRYRYLGQFLERNLNQRRMIEERLARAATSSAALYQLLRTRVVSPARVLRTWQACVLPNIEWLLSIWPSGSSAAVGESPGVVRAGVLYRKVLRRTLGLRRTGAQLRQVPTEIIEAEAGMEPVRLRAVMARLRLLRSILQGEKKMAETALSADLQALWDMIATNRIGTAVEDPTQIPWSLEVLLGAASVGLLPAFPGARGDRGEANTRACGQWVEAGWDALRAVCMESEIDIKSRVRTLWVQQWKASHGRGNGGLVLRSIPTGAVPSGEGFPKEAMYLWAGSLEQVRPLARLRVALQLPIVDAVRFWLGRDVPHDKWPGGARGDCCPLCLEHQDPEQHWAHVLCECPTTRVSRQALVQNLLGEPLACQQLASRLQARPLQDVDQGGVIDRAWLPALVVAEVIERDAGVGVLWDRSVRRVLKGEPPAPAVAVSVRVNETGRRWCRWVAMFAASVIRACCACEQKEHR